MGNYISYKDESGKLLSSEEIERLIDNPKVESLWQFIDDNLSIGVSYDTDLRKALKMYLGNRTI
nr:MAG TPA: Heat shock protein STI1 domain, Alpha helix, CHAPERONE [Caudoviricetes sp.]